MSATSILATVKAELVTAISAHSAVGTGPTKAAVTDYYPGDQAEREHIWLGRAEIDFSITALRAGRKTRDEDPTIEFGIEVTRDGDTQAQADVRAMQLLGAVEDVVANNPTLSVTAAAAGLKWIVLDRATIVPASSAEGFVTFIGGTLRYSARLT